MTRSHPKGIGGSLQPEDRASVPTEGQPISNARLVAELQAVALAIRIGGLEGLRDGSVSLHPQNISREARNV